MRIAPMTGHTGNGRNNYTFVVFVEAKIFFVDLTGHLVHMTGNILFRFGIAGKIEMMIRAVRRRRMTKITLYSQCSFPTIHDLIQIFVTDILRQDLQILWPFLRRTGCSHPGKSQSKDANNHGEFFVMVHTGSFDA